MKINSSEDDQEHERSIVYGLLHPVETLARGEILANIAKFKCGEVPPILFLESSKQDLVPIDIRYATLQGKGDVRQARLLCENAGVAVDAIAEMLVFERVLKADQLPQEVKGLRPEVLFAVGRYRNSPRERAFAMFRGGPSGIHLALAPNWRDFDELGHGKFASVLPDHKPSFIERKLANASLLETGFEIRGLSERLEQEGERIRKQVSGFRQEMEQPIKGSEKNKRRRLTSRDF